MKTLGVYLIGAGGHARALVEALTSSGEQVHAYVAREVADWLPVRRCEEADLPAGAAVVIGIGGVTPPSLERRVGLCQTGWMPFTVVHPRSIVSATARIEAGAQILAGAVIQPNARIGRLAIVNTGAIVEHDAEVGEGAHIAPGSIVLGGAKVGRFALVGAGSVVLPFATVPEKALVKATSLWHGPAGEASK